MALAQSHARPQQTYLAQQGMGRGGPSGLAEVLDVLLDKGLVIDAFVRVSLVGIELLTIDARIVIASVDTYLRFAEAVNRLDLLQANNSQSLGDLVGGRERGESRALSSRGKPREDESEPADAGEDGSSAGASASHDDSEEESRSEARDSAGEGSDDSSGDDKGLLTRIKERGQVF